jgi:hypothetical protein
MLNKNRGLSSEYYYSYAELGHTDVQVHNEILRHQSRRNSTARVGEDIIRNIREGKRKKKPRPTTRFFFSPSISNSSPGMIAKVMEAWGGGQLGYNVVLGESRDIVVRERRADLGPFDICHNSRPSGSFSPFIF